MFRTLLNIPLPQHLLLLVLVFLLRIPSFHGAFFAEEESLYLLCAERLAAGGSMYADAWFAGPPLIIWFYAAFVWLFGENALLFIRIFTCFYLYLTAVYFNGMIISFKALRRFPGIPAVLVILMASTPWYAQELNDSVLVLFPVVLAFHIIIQVRETRKGNRSRMFLAGILLMMCVLTTYKLLFLLIGLSISYLVLAQLKLDEFIALLGGLAVCLGLFVLILFLNNTLNDFWDIGLLYYMDKLGLAHSELYSRDMQTQLNSIVFTWGGILILSLLGFLHFRFRFYSYVVKVRSLEIVMAAWLFSVLLVLLFKLQRLEIQDFVLTIPPLAFYAGKIFDLHLPKILRPFPYLFMLSMPAYLYLTFIGLTLLQPTNFLHPEVQSTWLHGGMYETFESPLEPKVSAKTKAWVLDYQPQLYHRMNWSCANKYTDFRIAYYKIRAFSKGNAAELTSKPEPDREVFLQNLAEPPELILDVHGFFPYLQARFPNLFEHYVPKQYEKYTIYAPGAKDRAEVSINTER